MAIPKILSMDSEETYHEMLPIYFIPAFNGDNTSCTAREFLAAIDIYGDRVEWDPEIKIQIAMSKCIGQAYDIIANSPQFVYSVTWEEFCRHFLEAFPGLQDPTPNQAPVQTPVQTQIQVQVHPEIHSQPSNLSPILEDSMPEFNDQQVADMLDQIFRDNPNLNDLNNPPHPLPRSSSHPRLNAQATDDIKLLADRISILLKDEGHQVTVNSPASCFSPISQASPTPAPSVSDLGSINSVGSDVYSLLYETTTLLKQLVAILQKQNQHFAEVVMLLQNHHSGEPLD